MSESFHDQLIANIEAGYRHVVYDPKKDEIWLCSDCYRLWSGKKNLGDWVDLSGHKTAKHTRLKKLNNWIYLGLK